jgi:hypothetical protein
VRYDRNSIPGLTFPLNNGILLAREILLEGHGMATLAKIRYSHDGIIDEILLNPQITQRELAKMVGFTEGWLSICINSDAFKERLAERKGELVDPVIRASVQERWMQLRAEHSTGLSTSSMTRTPSA